MKQRFVTLAACLLLLIAVAPLVHAQSDSAPNKVGFVIRMDGPGRPTPAQADLLEHALRQIHHELADARAIKLIEQEHLVSAQARLGITLGIDSSLREMQLLANLLELDRLVVVKVTVSQHDTVALSAKVFNNDSDRIVVAAARASGAQLENVLERAIFSLLDALFPILAR